VLHERVGRDRDIQQRHFRSADAGDRHGMIERMTRELGEVDRAQDAADVDRHMTSDGADAVFGSGISVIVASVSSSTPAAETAFSSASRTTFVGSMIPASSRSTYWPVDASRPNAPLPFRIRSTTTPSSMPEFS